MALAKDPLYKALTRPAMAAIPPLNRIPITMESLLVSMAGTVVIFAATRAFSESIWPLLLFPVFYLLCYLIEKKEVRAFRLLALSLKSIMGCPIQSYWYWRALTYDPLPFANGKQRGKIH